MRLCLITVDLFAQGHLHSQIRRKNYFGTIISTAGNSAIVEARASRLGYLCEVKHIRTRKHTVAQAKLQGHHDWTQWTRTYATSCGD